MTYTPHWLLAFGGHQGNVEEQWACGIRLVEYDVPPGDGVEADDYIEDIAKPALTTWFGSANAQIAALARLTWIKFNRIAPSGKYEDTANTHEQLGLALAGGVAAVTSLHPLQVAMVLRWHTNDAERGLASRGRIYSPRPAIPVDINGDITAQYRLPAATAAATLLNTLDIGVGVGGVLRPSIVSKGRPPYTDEGPFHQIDLVSVDSALDMQHRRARSQSRESSSFAVSY